MENVAINITDYLIEKQLINSNKKEWCVYWVQKKILSLVSCLIFFAIAMYNHNAVETFVFVISLMLLRKRTGGYHANSLQVCILLSSLLVLVMPYGVDLISNKGFALFTVVTSLYIIQRFAPVNHPAMHMNVKECEESRKLALKTFWVLLTVSILLLTVGKNILSYCIVLAMFCDSAFIVLAKILRQEV